MQDMTNVHVY